MTTTDQRFGTALPWIIEAPHALSGSDVVHALETSVEAGLTEESAASRLSEVGPNRLQEAPRPGLLSMLADQFNDFLIWLLIIAAIVAASVSYLEGEGYADSIAIIAIVILNAGIGVFQERRAENAMRALQEMAAPEANVIRGGHHLAVPAHDVVPGDVVLLEAGNYVPADLRLIEIANLRVDEASLTGESVPVSKDADAIAPADSQPAERRNIAFGGTVVSYGRGRGVTVATGMETAIGHIADMIQSHEREDTPLQRRLDQLGKNLGVITLIVCAIVFAVGLYRATDLAVLASSPVEFFELYRAEIMNMFMVAVSLAIAAVPEGLPAVVTIALAIGMQRMVERNALVRRLPAVETLGSATTICSDKTGTLTQSEMVVVQAEARGPTVTVTGEGYAPEGEWIRDGQKADPTSEPDLRLLAGAGLLASDAVIELVEGRWTVVGDPTEGALVAFASRSGLDRGRLERGMPRVAEIPFDSARKRMTTIHRVDDSDALEDVDVPVGTIVACVKGAPDLLVERCSHYYMDGQSHAIEPELRNSIGEANHRMAQDALRVLAVAYRVMDAVPDELDADGVERDLVLLGLVGMMDPPRPEVRDAVATARTAGIRTVMITGDYRDTAVAIASDLGILHGNGRSLSGAEIDELDDTGLLAQVDEVDVFARVSPAHKVRIVEAMKARGEIVAMTGDGVNDAPALKRAHIGVAMGLTGTDVSRETADMVLTDDNYASIVAAIEEGRTIYSNIRKFVYFLLSCNVGEILIIFIGMLFALAPEPVLLPIMLLWVNLVTDGLPALALALEAPEADVMEQKPRDPQQAILSRDTWSLIAVQASFDAIATLSAFMWAYDGEETLRYAQTVAFATLTCAELLRAFTSRSDTESVFTLGLFSNRWMVLATAASFALLLVALYLPGVRDAFSTVPLTINEWIPIFGFALLPATAAEVTKWFRRWHHRRQTAA